MLLENPAQSPPAPGLRNEWQMIKLVPVIIIEQLCITLPDDAAVVVQGTYLHAVNFVQVVGHEHENRVLSAFVPEPGVGFDGQCSIAGVVAPYKSAPQSRQTDCRIVIRHST